jgi:hypothetical protein
VGIGAAERPRHGFQRRGGAIFFGMVAMFAAWFFQVEYQWDGMQRHYLAHYVVSSAGLFQKYLVLHTVDRRGRWHPTVPAEVVPVQMASYPHGAIPFRLSPTGVEQGAVRLVNPVIPDKARFAAFLRDWVYDGQNAHGPGQAWYVVGTRRDGCGAVLRLAAGPEGAGHPREWAPGARLAELVTRDEFNRARKYRVGMGSSRWSRAACRSGCGSSTATAR